MRRWIGWVAYLYPASWRARYGAEFDALLDDANVRWRDLADVLRGAFIMQLTSWKSYGKIAGAAAVACAILALAGSYLIPNRYESKAVMRISPQSPSSDSTPGVVDEDLTLRLEQVQLQVLGRSSLVELIQEPQLDLYKEERKRMTIGVVAEKMRMHDISIRLYETPAGGKPGAQAFEVRFAYPDRYKARQVVRELSARFMMLNHTLAQKAGLEGNPGMEQFTTADLPATPAMPNHVAFLWVGLGAGLLLGLLATLIWRRPKWTLQIAGFGGAGFVLALAVAYFIPNVYVSLAALRITGTADSARVADRLQEIEQRVLSHDNLARLIQLPQLDLYKKQRAQMPLADVVEKMRSKDLRIRVYTAPSVRHVQAFAILFSYPDRYKAQSMVRELSGQFVESSLGNPREQGYTVDLLEPAYLPETPASPNRLSIATLGAFAGLLIGLVTLRWRSSRRALLTPAPASA
jgi:LPS O-antigen subunit length determinant protein (WzzB/FepE family)